MSKEARARIKINELLKQADWKFFDDAKGKANIILENNVKITESRIDALGKTSKHGRMDLSTSSCSTKGDFHSSC